MTPYVVTKILTRASYYLIVIVLFICFRSHFKISRLFFLIPEGSFRASSEVLANSLLFLKALSDSCQMFLVLTNLRWFAQIFGNLHMSMPLKLCTLSLETEKIFNLSGFYIKFKYMKYLSKNCVNLCSDSSIFLYS